MGVTPCRCLLWVLALSSLWSVPATAAAAPKPKLFASYPSSVAPGAGSP